MGDNLSLRSETSLQPNSRFSAIRDYALPAITIGGAALGLCAAPDPALAQRKTVECGVCSESIEVLECGEIHPWLLNESHLPSQRWSGLAMGIGLDRLVMLIKQIDDIRLLRSSDPRVARQMLTLEPYEPVSNQPATHRDMSICVADPDMELLGDRIRNVLGERGGWVENVELIQASDHASVPEKARERLGMSLDQHNLLIRVTLRSLDGSITKEDANRAYDLVYAELHEGTGGYFRASQTAASQKPPP